MMKRSRKYKQQCRNLRMQGIGLVFQKGHFSDEATFSYKMSIVTNGHHQTCQPTMCCWVKSSPAHQKGMVTRFIFNGIRFRMVKYHPRGFGSCTQTYLKIGTRYKLQSSILSLQSQMVMCRSTNTFFNFVSLSYHHNDNNIIRLTIFMFPTPICKNTATTTMPICHHGCFPCFF